MAIRIVECVEWAVPDKPGELLKYANCFRTVGINLDALWAYGCGKGKARMAAVGKDPRALMSALRMHGLDTEVSKGFYVAGKDKAGALVAVAKTLAKAGINIEYVSALAAQGRYGAAFWVPDSKFQKARKLLRAR